MDLPLVVQQMRLDDVAVQASCSLRAAGVPHVLLKGPTTSRWLYSPPRTYRDVDLLVPSGAIRAAVKALTESGVAAASAGRLGEEASHSLLMLGPTGVELDLHATLPMLDCAPHATELLWEALSQHVQGFELNGVVIPALDAPARCLVIALHALGNGDRDERSLEDLRRARATATYEDWEGARRLACQMGVSSLLLAGITLVEPGEVPGGLPLAARLRMEGATGGVYQLERLRGEPRRRWPGLILRELFPSVGFMRYANPVGTQKNAGLAKAYLIRIIRLCRELPGDYVSWRRLRRQVL